MNITADEMIKYLKEYLERCLTELYQEEQTNDFIYGEKTAYVECLEALQAWAYADRLDLNYDVEKRFPLAKQK